MRKNEYVEMRHWKLFWGLTFDSQKEINKIIKKYNDLGWTCTHFQLGLMPNLDFLKMLIVTVVFILTVGFVQFWVGPTFLFEKEI